MKIADLQVLFFAIDATSSHHLPALRWLEDAINGAEPFGLTWPTVHQFLRLGTHPAFPGCMPEEEALGWIEEWIGSGMELVGDGDVGWELLSELVHASPRALRNAVDDAHLAAVAISRGASLASFDGDFDAFVAHGLRLERLTA